MSFKIKLTRKILRIGKEKNHIEIYLVGVSFILGTLWQESGRDIMRMSVLVSFRHIFDVLYDLLPFVQFKKREKHAWRSLNFSKLY